MFEIITHWTIPSGVQTSSVMYFDSQADLGGARQVINDMWTAIRSRLVTGLSWTIDPNARVLSEVTGQLQGIASDPTSRSGTGSGAGLAVADATQVLMRWSTGQVRNGRFVQGRTFVPGLDANLLSGGNLGAGSQTAIAAAGQDMLLTGAGFGVWHRPKNGGGGQLLQAFGCSVNSELAVLRRRRNR